MHLSPATAGDVVHVYAGEYTETFSTAKKGVTLRGASIRGVTIKSQYKANLMMRFC